MALVIKHWYANTTPNSSGNYVEIAARKSGLIAWLLALFKVDPSFFLYVAYDQITFERSNFAGYKKIVVTTENVSSTFYGYSKPWVQAASIFMIFLMIAVGLAQGSAFGAFITLIVGLIIAIVYYLLNKEEYNLFSLNVMTELLTLLERFQFLLR